MPIYSNHLSLYHRGLLPVALTLLSVGGAIGQDAPVRITPSDQGATRREGAADPKPIQIEVQPVRELFHSGGPVLIRFLIINNGPDAIEIPLDSGMDLGEGLRLPLTAIVGTGSTPALVIESDGSAADVRTLPEAQVPSEQDQGPPTLRIAGSGVLGATLDLRSLYPNVQYTGSYRLEWRPFGGKFGASAVKFRVAPRKEAVLVTEFGKITFELEYDRAPKNVAHFMELVESKFYVGKTIHRIVPGFAIQGGSPNGDGSGTLDKRVAAEFHDAPFELGTLAMARLPNEPDSASCQFFITLSRQPELDGEYTVIGQASDEQSLRTLQTLSALATDARDRPIQQLIIRSITLVDSQTSESRRTNIQVKPVNPSRSTSATQPSLNRSDR